MKEEKFVAGYREFSASRRETTNCASTGGRFPRAKVIDNVHGILGYIAERRRLGERWVGALEQAALPLRSSTLGPK